MNFIRVEVVKEGTSTLEKRLKNVTTDGVEPQRQNLKRPSNHVVRNNEANIFRREYNEYEKYQALYFYTTDRSINVLAGNF